MTLRNYTPQRLWVDVAPYRGTFKVRYDKAGNMKLYQNDVDALKSNVAFVCVYKAGKYRAIGTAFLLSIAELNGRVFWYWVTCKHVVDEYVDNNGHSKDLYLRLNVPDKKVDYIPMEGQWVYHPDKAVDLAVLYWLPSSVKGVYELLATEARDIGLEPDREPRYKGQVREGHEVVLLGMFPEYYGDERNLPMFRFGKISLVTDEKTPNTYGYSNHYFIECDIWQGTSGSPVYVARPLHLTWGDAERTFSTVGPLDPDYPNGDPPLDIPTEVLEFYGVATGFYPHRARVKSKPKSHREKDIKDIVLHYGISLVTPSDKVAEVLYGDTMKEKRQKRINEDKEKNKPEPASVDSGDWEEESELTQEKFEETLRKIARPLKKDAPKKKGT